MKRVYVREEYCIGCRLCEIYCIMAHSCYPYDVLKAFKKDKNRPLPRILVEEKGPLSFAFQCRHCDEPECVKACISGAMHKDRETGIVICDTEKCVGCWTCIAACPYGAARRNERSGKAVKCDLCSNWGEIPACVKYCPNEALVFLDIKEDIQEDEVVGAERDASCW